jgi:hypothetical protein
VPSIAPAGAVGGDVRGSTLVEARRLGGVEAGGRPCRMLGLDRVVTVEEQPPRFGRALACLGEADRMRRAQAEDPGPPIDL